MNVFKDDSIVLTLDAGGTNFVFSALQKGSPMTGEIIKPSNGEHLEKCLYTIKKGFEELISILDDKPRAISFAFPGPADYPKGIIGDLLNLPGFRGGVPLASILEQHFNLPVFINNDGDLFAFGEALGGTLPEINRKLEISGNPRRYKNLIGLTLGTGFGGGIVRNNELFTGDNSLASEVWLLNNRMNNEVNAEELISIRAVQRSYGFYSGSSKRIHLTPKDINNIALGLKEGNKAAAVRAFEDLGRALGDSIANIMTLIDGVVVIGGGLTGASSLYMPALMKELNTTFNQGNGTKIPRLVQKVFNLDNWDDSEDFYKNHSVKLPIDDSGLSLSYDPQPKLAIATSKLGASRAISLGAYAFALKRTVL